MIELTEDEARLARFALDVYAENVQSELEERPDHPFADSIMENLVQVRALAEKLPAY